MIKDCNVETSYESKLGAISFTTSQFTSVEEACSYILRVNREYANLKYHGIIKSYNIQFVSIECEEQKGGDAID